MRRAGRNGSDNSVVSLNNTFLIAHFENRNHPVLRIIIEPEGCYYDLPQGEVITVEVSGKSGAFHASSSYNEENRVHVLAFWPEQGSMIIRYKGENLRG